MRGRSVKSIGYLRLIRNLFELVRRFSLRVAGLVCATVLLTGAVQKADNLPDHPLQGPDGVTSLSGQVMDIDGNGLPGVELSVGTSRTLTDDAGRFLLTYVIPGKTVLQ